MNYTKIHQLRKKILEFIRNNELIRMNQSEPNRPRYAKSQNKELFEMLNEIGIFNFYITNSGNTIQLSQIIYFCRKVDGGWFQLWFKANVMQKGQDVVHHLDHNPENNNRSNLAYLPHFLNIQVSSWCEDIRDGQIKIDEVKRKIQHLEQSIRKTILKTISKTIEYWEKLVETVVIDGVICKIYDKVVKPSYGGLSAKQMLVNFRKFGYCRSASTF